MAAAACAGGLWLLYRRARAEEEKRKGGSAKTLLGQGTCTRAGPAESPQLRRYVDAALHLGGLPFHELAPCAAGGLGAVALAYSEELPAELRRPGRGRQRCGGGGRGGALAAAAGAAALVLALLLMATAALMGQGGHLPVVGAAAATCLLVARLLERALRAMRRGSRRAAVCRAEVEVPAAVVPGVWRALTNWVVAPPPATLTAQAGADDGWQRGFARRGPCSVLVEGRFGEGAITPPLTAFVFQPHDDSAGGAALRAYFVPATPGPPAEVLAGARARVQELLARAAMPTAACLATPSTPKDERGRAAL